jgi:hypothetical protein
MDGVRGIALLGEEADDSLICDMTESRIRRVALGPLVVLLLCGVAITPLLRGASPCTHDGGLYYHYAATLKHTVKQGILFSRWLPDLAFGYGYPLFNYRGPICHYLALGLQAIGLTVPWALNLVYVLSILGSAVGMYLLARDLFGVKAGLVAAVAYAYAPYQFLDALLRGNMPESVALALMPFVLWVFRRLALWGGRRWFLAAVGSLAALYLSHNISSLLFTPLLLAYLVMLRWVYRRGGHWTRVALAFGLALGLSAFLWFPALGEKGYVQLDMARTTRNNDFHYNFLGLPEMLAPPAAVDTSLMNPPMRIHLGMVQALLGGLGLILGLVLTVRRMKHRDRGASREQAGPGSKAAYGSGLGARRPRDLERAASLILSAAFAVLYLFITTPASEWIWEHVPLLSFVQFPWRLVGRAALPVALLAGASAYYAMTLLQDTGAERLASHLSHLLPLIIAVTLILSALPSTYPPQGYCPQSPHPTIQDVFAYEHRSGLVGVDPEGSYFPVWVEQRPEQSPLEGQYDSVGSWPRRFDEAALPEGAEVMEADYGPNRARVVVESPEPFQARYLSFYFPGWRARVDGERTAITPSEPQGLITFDVPAGRHTIQIRFGETPLRLVADGVSALALLALVLSTILGTRSSSEHRGWRISCERVLLGPDCREWTSFSGMAGFLIAAALLLILKLAVVDRIPTPFRHSELQPGGTLPGVEHAAGQSYTDGLHLIGYDQSAGQMPADGTLGVDLYWTVREQPMRRYQTVVHLVGPDGFRWSRDDSFRPRDHQDAPPTYTWTPGRYALDSQEVEPLPGAPPGRYDVVLTVFDRERLTPLSVLNDQGQPSAPDLRLGQVTLTRPRRPVALPEDERLDLSLMPFTLLTADFDREEAAPGDAVYLTLMWQADDDFHCSTSSCCGPSLVLLTPDGTAAATYQLPPPVSSWEEGDVWRSQHRLNLPATLEKAVYTWTVELCSLSSYPIGELAVEALDRAFTPPPMDIETDVRLGNVATLVGANLTAETSPLKPGTTLTVTLVWRAEAETDISYRVFLHLVGPDGALIAQSDGVPVGWTRPTTGWLDGEVITDVRALDIPVDAPTGDDRRYTLYAGLYTSEGGRLSTPDGTDAIPVTTVTIRRLEAG